jgi:hypothetical protein
VADDIKTLLLRVEATTELLRAEVRRGEQSLARLDERATKSGDKIDSAFARISRSAASLKTALAGLAGGIAISTFVSLGRGALQFADDLQTAADRANVSVETYQRLREALRALELDTAQTNKVLESLITTLGEAQSGNLTAQQADALERLGVAAKIASGEIQDTAGFLDELGRAASRYSNQAQFAADLSAIVGQRLGPKLAAALADGGQAFRDLAAAANVASDAQVAALAAASEALDRTRENWRRSVISIAGSAVILFEQLGQAVQLARQLGGRIPLLDALKEVRREAELAQKFPLDRFLPQPPQSGPLPQQPPRSQRPDRDSLPRLAKSVRETDRELAVFQARMDNFAEVAAKLTAEAGSFPKMRDVFKDMEPIINRTIPNLSKPFEDAARFARSLSDNLAQAIVNGQGIGRALVSSFKAAAAEAISSGLFRLLIGTGETGVPTGLIGGLFSKLGGLFGGFRASGGPVSAGRAYVVGERGPELFVPRAAGVIQPSAGGGGTVINVDARGAVSPSAVAEATVFAVRTATRYTDARLGRMARPTLPRGGGAP